MMSMTNSDDSLLIGSQNFVNLKVKNTFHKNKKIK